jgi:plastocyanin
MLLLGVSRSYAAIIVPGADGSDGALNITVDTVIDLSLATTGTWNASNTANAGKGIYDASKWAVVFKYSSVTVAAGKTLTFKNHVSRAPVVWLVSGNVDIAGTVSLNGQNSQSPPLLSDGGPGGFRGAIGTYSTGVNYGAGFGPGGGQREALGGAYGTSAHNNPVGYGNPSLVPLIGGSGGSGASYNNATAGGGGGGGAILIASQQAVTISGVLRSNGGNGAAFYFNDMSGAGSGGGIRVVCDTLNGLGQLQALAGTGGANGFAGLGRIRLERVNNSNSISVAPDPSVIPLAPNDTALLWPPSDAPQVKIVSIGAKAIPADPLASFGTVGADAALPQTTSTQAVIETTNVEQASSVKVRVTPRSNANFTEVAATVSSVVSTTPLVVRWTATLPVNVGYSAVQVKVIRP